MNLHSPDIIQTECKPFNCFFFLFNRMISVFVPTTVGPKQPERFLIFNAPKTVNSSALLKILWGTFSTVTTTHIIWAIFRGFIELQTCFQPDVINKCSITNLKDLEIKGPTWEFYRFRLPGWSLKGLVQKIQSDRRKRERASPLNFKREPRIKFRKKKVESKPKRQSKQINGYYFIIEWMVEGFHQFMNIKEPYVNQLYHMSLYNIKWVPLIS